jgi:MFS family permease
VIFSHTLSLDDLTFLSPSLSPSSLEIDYEVDFNTDRNWHAITLYSHYILGCGFFILAILLTLKTWQIRDYTNREDVKQFIFDYIADRWYLRGGMKILAFMIFACVVVVGVLGLVYGISQENNYNAPNPLILGSIGCVCLSAIGGIFILGLSPAIRSAHSSHCLCHSLSVTLSLLSLSRCPSS